MKRFALLMALVGLTCTGCVNNKVFGPLARNKGNQNIRAELDGTSDTRGGGILLAAFGGGC